MCQDGSRLTQLASHRSVAGDAGGNGRNLNETQGWWKCRDQHGQGESMKFNRLASWAVFHYQFKVMANHNNWISCQKAVHLLAVLEG
jgi:hypothetical protein